jgi:hypothetical protein
MAMFRAPVNRSMIALGRLALFSAMLLGVALLVGWARRVGL